jgi:2-polyprenyl-3-methyl-5-hydroxy-6-metoxy-1,4-benzoquinol methylase
MRIVEQSRGTQPSSGRAAHASPDDPYARGEDGIYRPPVPVAHRDEEYPSEGFESLLAMQQKHFWYRGRHRFILHFTRKLANRLGGKPLQAIDLGGGCGGWVSYLRQHAPALFAEIALADSSAIALAMASPLVSRVDRYQIDLLDLHWAQRWDVAFMLDVLEHIENDVAVLRQVRSALRPGGFLVVTTPALERFRTPIDDLSHHVRRYSRGDLAHKADAAGLELVTSRYFMFFLSPLLLLSRHGIADATKLSSEEARECLRQSARIPLAPLNALLAGVFGLESPLGDWLPFPWGTSVLAVFRRPL